MRYYIPFFILLLLSSKNYGQPFFSRVYNQPQPSSLILETQCNSIVRTTDSGYLLSYAYYPLGGIDFSIAVATSVLVKTDSLLVPKWRMNISGLNPKTIPLDNGACLVWGAQGGLLRAEKIDTAGNTVWGKSILWNGTDGFIAEYAVYTGTKIRFAGYTFVFGISALSSATPMYIDIDTAGNVLASDTLHLANGINLNTISGMTMDASGNYIITGSEDPSVSTGQFIIKMTSSDAISWCEEIWATYAAPTIFSSLPLNDGSILFGGLYYDSLIGNVTMLGKLSPTGSLIWGKEFDTGTGFRFNLQQLSDGDILMGNGSILIKMDTAANIIWAKNFSGNITAMSPAYFKSPDNWYFAALTKDSFSAVIFNTDSLGNSLCPPATDTFVLHDIYLPNDFITVTSVPATFHSVAQVPDTAKSQPYTDTCAGYVGHAATLGTKNMLQESSSISVYPNPTTTQLAIRSTGHPINQITITNLLGQSIFTNRYNSQQVTVNVTDLPTGIYFIKINGVDTRKFVKQ